ncbi:MAG TPA: MFS transporter [Mycobacteriales bacterium]|nr:MFS transporter [Mycobacteriales bacterium]
MTIFSSLRVRNYRLFAAGQVVSLTGTWMQRVAQDWLVVQLTHGSGSALGYATALQFLPTLFLSLYGGVVADRHSKRRLLIVTQAVMGAFALALGLLVVTHSVVLWHVYLLAFLLGLASAIDTPTRQAFVAELVGPAQVVNAVSLNSATFNLARIAGPAAAGLLIEAIGTGPVFLFNAVSFLAVIGGLVLMREADLYLAPRQPRAAGQLRAGLAYVRGRPDLLWPIVLVGIVGTFGLNFQMTMALIAKNVFHRNAGSYGLLSTALAFGSLIGALLAARRPRPRQSLLIGSALAFGILETISGLMPSYLTLVLLLIPTGVAALTLSTAANTTMQLGSSAAMRGRVMALYVLVFLGGTPIGAPIVGWVAQVAGARYSLILGGAISAVAALVVGLVLARSRQLRVEPHLFRRHPHVHIRLPEEAPMPRPDIDEVATAS